MKLHDWRVKFNGNDIGYGLDQYKPEEKYHYPEAYAVFGRGYLKLYQATKNEEYLECAHKCYDWLIRNPSPRYTNLSWGLPWAWKEWDAPKDMSYVCTTMYAGDFFVNLYKQNKDKQVMKNIKSVYDWLLTENGFKKADGGINFYYANHEPLKFTIYNHNGLALSFLSNYFSITQDSTIKKMADRTYIFLNKNKNNYNLWHYSSKSELMDNFHEANILEGIIDYNDIFKKSNDVLSSKSIKIFKKLFANSEGGMRDTAHLLSARKNRLKAYINYIKTKDELSPPARLWSYGASLRILSKSNFPIHMDFRKLVINYLISNLQNPEGYFNIAENNKLIAIRHEAHALEGLVTSLVN